MKRWKVKDSRWKVKDGRLKKKGRRCVSIVALLLFLLLLHVCVYVYVCISECACGRMHECTRMNTHVCAVVFLHTSIATTSPSTALFIHSRPEVSVKERKVVVNEMMRYGFLLSLILYSAQFYSTLLPKSVSMLLFLSSSFLIV